MGGLGPRRVGWWRWWRRLDYLNKSYVNGRLDKSYVNGRLVKSYVNGRLVKSYVNGRVRIKRMLEMVDYDFFEPK